MERDLSVNHSLFVIITSRGDQYGMYGTEGERIEYLTITTRFDEVPGLRGKPKIFILDDCGIGKIKLIDINYICMLTIKAANISQYHCLSVRLSNIFFLHISMISM